MERFAAIIFLLHFFLPSIVAGLVSSLHISTNRYPAFCTHTSHSSKPTNPRCHSKLPFLGPLSRLYKFFLHITSGRHPAQHSSQPTKPRCQPILPFPALFFAFVWPPLTPFHDNSRPCRRLIHYLLSNPLIFLPALRTACMPGSTSFSATFAAQPAVTLNLNFRLKMARTKVYIWRSFFIAQRFSRVRFAVCQALLDDFLFLPRDECCCLREREN